MIWESDEACVEAREEVENVADIYVLGTGIDKSAKRAALDEYATAVAVCCLEEVLAVGDKDAVRDQVVLLLEQIKAKGVVK